MVPRGAQRFCQQDRNAMSGRYYWFAAALLAIASMTTSPAEAGASTRRVGSVDFEPCTLTGSQHVGAVAAQCAHYSVPENPAQPNGRKIELRLAIVGSRSPRSEPDWVTLIAGGPGQSAVDSFPEALQGFDYLHRHHTILLVDQRGTGGSHLLQCAQGDWNAPDIDDPAVLRHFASDCRKHLEADADLTQYTTDVAVEDLDTVRRALGLGPLDLVGVSYGTRVALEYLRRHPEGTRSLILDSVVPPDRALGQENASNLDDAIGKIFAQCRDDKACHDRFGDPAATLQDLRKRLQAAPMHADIADPVTGTLTAATLYPSTLSGIVRLYAYSPEFASLLPLLIDEAGHGRPQPMLAQGKFIFSHFADSIAFGMQLSVTCAEDAPLLHAVNVDAGSVSGPGFVEGVQTQCAEWPRGTIAKDFHEPVVSDKPVLLMEGAWDPVTPPRYAESVASHLSNSKLLVAAGQGHNVIARGCMPKLAQQFVDKLDPKHLDTSCIKTFGPTPAFTQYLGAGP
jgi:pimeloyl-ACP methyl ester carboxylesterase